MIFPLYIAFTTATTPYSDLSSTFRWRPSRPTLSAFVDVWSDMPLARHFVNSAVVTVGTVVIAIPIALAAAYAVGRYRFAGRRTFMAAILSTQMFPGIFFPIPLFPIFVKVQTMIGVQLVGSRGGLIFVYLSFALPL